MKWCEGKRGRCFVLRLEDGEIIHEAIEAFCREQRITAGTVSVVGGIDKGSRLIVGPEDGRSAAIVPTEIVLEEVHEACGTGTIFPDQQGNPLLHLHISCGRGRGSVTGCVRRGVRVWLILEVVIDEITGAPASRVEDPATGFKLLSPGA